MRQEAALRVDDLTSASSLPLSRVELAALAAANPGPVPDTGLPPDPATAASPAVAELLALIRQGYAEPPATEEAQPQASGEAHQVLALGPDTHDPASLPEATHYSIELLATPQSPVLSLDDQDLFGQGLPVAPQSVDQGATGDFFHGFQVDLFGQQPPVGTTLEAGLDPGLPPLVEPTLSAGLVTMYEGRSVFELTPELAATLLDEQGNLLVVGDGDDVVVLGSGWNATDANGSSDYAYYLNGDAGITVAIKGADVIFV